jgi:hypothetical protein
MWDLWWTKWHRGRFSPRIQISPVNHSTDRSTLIIIRGWYNRTILASVIVDSVPLHPPKKGSGVRNHVQIEVLASLTIKSVIFCDVT